MKVQKLAGPVLGGLMIFIPLTGLARDDGSGTPPAIESGAIEAGIDGAMTTTEGITNGAVLLRVGIFRAALGGLAGVELNGGYRHISSLNATDLEAVVSWQKRFRRTGSYPYVSVGGGLRHEDIGSFAQTLYPFGFSVGVRTLLGQRAGFRAEYRLRRVFNDPSSDFSEHRLMVGLSIFFRNQMQRSEKP
jgi:hypothetical protein